MGLGLAAALSVSAALSAASSVEFKKVDAVLSPPPAAWRSSGTPPTAKEPIPIVLEVAETEEQAERGLMGRMEVPKGTGMIFDVHGLAYNLWMKDTPSSLDLFYLDKNQRILAVKERAVPFDTTPWPSPSGTAGALELGAGEAARLGVGVGWSVVLPPR